MEVIFRTILGWRAFLLGLVLGAIVVFFLGDFSEAATGVMRPNGNGTLNQGTAFTCGAGGNYDCLDDIVTAPTAPASTTSDYLQYGRNQAGFFQTDSSSITGVNTVTQIQVPVYHKEGSSNMQMDVSIWDATETTQYGTTQNFTVRTSSAWDTATFSGLSLNQTQLDGLKVRLGCTRPSGGGATNCQAYAMYANVTYTEQINVTVATTTASQQNLQVGTTTANVGGAFSFIETNNCPSCAITGITITESGTANAQTDLYNVRIRYDLDTTAPYNCESESYSGTEPQFGSTTTFNGANGTASFTGNVSVSTTQAMCAYVVTDVLSTASYGTTLEFSIANPSTNVTISGGTVVRPTTALALVGTTVLLDDDLTQTRYHWRQDNGDQTDNALLGADSATGGTENTPIDTAIKATNYRLRTEVSNEGNTTSSATQYLLEYATKITTCSAISEAGWTSVDAAADDWDMSASTFISDGNTTNIATAGKGAITDDNSSFLGTGALRESSALSGSLTLSSTQFTELEYSIIGSTGIVDGTTYCFRVTNNGSPLAHYTTYPEITFNADVVVAAEESQVSTISIPSTNIMVGAFSMTDTAAGGHDIDEITITASSSADVTTAFDNIELYYETDTSSPYDCASESYGGVLETLYGGQTDTDGFSANGTSTFTGGILSTPTVNPTQAVCVYVVLDVTSGAVNGDQLDIQIVNPSTDVVLSSGTVAPASLVDLNGTTLLTQPFVVQGNYHWRNNDGDETASGASSATGGAENTVLDEVSKSSTIRIRFDVSNTGGEASGNYQYRLEWAQKPASCSAVSGGSWIDVDVANDEFAVVSSQLVDGANTTDIAVSAGGVTNQAGTFLSANTGQEETSSQTGNINLAADEYAELEYSIQATASTSEGASYCFRLTNAGTELNDYLQYAELNIKLATDFAISRGVATILNGNSTASITEGTEYSLQFASSSRAFVRITNAAQTGAGPASTGNHNASDVTAYISNPSNITSGITFTRAGITGDTRVAWEVIEYVGASGGENEIIVRDANVATYVAANTTVTTGSVTVSDDNDVVPWITGQGNPDGGRFDYNTGLSTSAWNAGADTATFTRGESGSDAVNVSYAIIEFVGLNWTIQRSEKTYSATPGTPESDTSFSPVISTTQTFLHVQKRVGSGLDTHAEFGHEVYLSGVGAITYRLDGGATTPGSHTSVAWIIENTQTQGNVMKVWQSNGTISSGAAPQIANPSIGTDLNDIGIASILVNGRADGTGRTFQEPIFSARLLNSSSTAYEIWVGDPSDNVTYRTEVVEWPTANAKLTQNYFQFFVDNGSPTPTDPWPIDGGIPNLAENDEMTAEDGPMASGQSIRVRMSLTVTAATLAAGSTAFDLEYAERPPASTCGTISENQWYGIGEVGSTTALWRATNTAPVAGSQLPSTILSVSDVAGTYEEGNPSAFNPDAVLVDDDIEYDWHIQNNGASDKTDYCLRMTLTGGAPLDSYTRYPVIRTVGYEPVLGDWRWFDDEASITPIVALAALNTAPIDVANDNIIKLRTVVEERSGATGENIKFKVQYSEEANFSTVFDVVASTTCTENSIWCYANGAGTDNATITAATIGSADTCSGGSGIGCGTHNEGTSTINATLDHTALANTEFEFTLQHAGARVNTVYYFRLYDLTNDAVITASTSYPSLVTEGGSLTFALTGVSAGASTEGVITDVTTTPTAIPFGSVPIDTEFEAAYRLNVDTNATQGYQILMFSRQDMLDSYGNRIDPIAGTNGSPVAWDPDGCAPAAIGCIGYHAGDDALSSAPQTRFSPNNSYAAISTTTPEEVMYSSQPSAADSTDIIFKLQVSDLQPAGQYNSELVFISVPIF